MAPARDSPLLETLREAQRFGLFGPGAIELAIAHADAFVEALADMPAGARLIDLGSGGGLPGLRIADRLRTLDITLIDRRAKRTDFLAQAVGRLGLGHVHVVCDDARRLAAAVSTGQREPFHAATARGFGPPDSTLRLARRLVGIAGRIVISEPPVGNRWPEELLAELDVDSERVGPVRRFHVKHGATEPLSVGDVSRGTRPIYEDARAAAPDKPD